ncbi:nuclear transport factor 2 family protein [Maribacter sp. R77961]|uniref:nuclear transport factor 2 family protein n=1 Tax=Maribacter sp. R77961 TaxID=3093871 RepID=UPI0037C5A6FA
MKKISILLFLVGSLTSAQDGTKEAIATTLDTWHKAASNAEFDAYFDLMTTDAVFIGTDAMENWNIPAFKAYSKPHFDKGKAWSFTAVERNIYVDEAQDFAWFDELLNTQMKLCRGSGVLRKTDIGWKIAHYVLSIAVPNEHVSELIAIKKDSDNSLLEKLSKN